MEEFCVDLPSGTYYSGYRNSQSDYKVQLAKPLIFKKPTKVMLAEFGYRDFMFFEIGTFNISLMDFDNTNDIYKIDTFYSYTLIAYDNEPLNHMFNRINNEITNYFSKFVYCIQENLLIDYDFIDENLIKDIQVNFDSDKYNILYNKIKDFIPKFKAIENNLYMLEFNRKTKIRFDGVCKEIFSINSNELKSNHEFSLFSEVLNFIDFLYIYCDIIEHQYVGDAYAPLIKKIGKSSDFNKTVHIIFTDNDFVNVSSNFISDINIKVLDKTGNQIKFGSKNSEVHAKLRFKSI